MYATATIEHLATEDCRDRQGEKLVEQIAFFPPARYRLAPMSFGAPEIERRTLIESPFAGHWRQEWVEVPQQFLYRMRGATIHSTAGIILLGNNIISDNLVHVHFPEHGLSRNLANGRISVHSSGLRHVEGRVFHLLSGGHDGYYHWMTDVIARLTTIMKHPNLASTLALPAITRGFQRATVEAIRLPTPLPAHFVERQASLSTNELLFMPTLTGWGWTPHPEILTVFDQLKASIASARPSRRIYISRLDANNRPLTNEGEIVAMMAQAGYEILAIGQLPWYEQIRAFAEATHIVAPHGAGLTNILFCAEGSAAICELHMDSAVNWCFRSLASLRNLRYGCVIGDTEPEWRDYHPQIRGWTVDCDMLRSTLRSEGFL